MPHHRARERKGGGGEDGLTGVPMRQAEAVSLSMDERVYSVLTVSKQMSFAVKLY